VKFEVKGQGKDRYVVKKEGNDFTNVKASSETMDVLDLVEKMPKKPAKEELAKIAKVVLDADYYIGNGKITKGTLGAFLKEHGDQLTAQKLGAFINDKKAVKFKV
jgi:hypothetical protein